MTQWDNKIETSAGDIIDKITILNIKLIKINNPEKIGNIQRELEILSHSFVAMLNFIPIEKRDTLKNLKTNLFAVNLRLWSVKDDIRRFGKGIFGSNNVNDEFIFSLSPSQLHSANAFMLLARDFYLVNGERFSLKTKISKLLESRIVEEKSH